MKQSEIIAAIAALSKAIEANRSFTTGSSEVQHMANQKLKELIPLVRTKPYCLHKNSVGHSAIHSKCTDCGAIFED